MNYLFDGHQTTGYPLHRESRENGTKKFPDRENTGNLEILQNKTGNFVCLSCKITDSIGERNFNICSKNFQKFVEAGLVCQVIFVFVIVTNHINWHRENLRSDREKTGNLKMKFEWVP